MVKRTPSFAKSTGADDTIRAVDLPRHRDMWLLTGEINRNSQRTIDARRDLLSKLSWFLNKRGIELCDTMALRQFLHYATNGHKEEGGRWGNPRMTRQTKPGTIKDYHAILRTFFGWLVLEGIISESPMTRVQAPIDRPDQIQPFSDEQLRALLSAARKSIHPVRDEAIILLLLDTGLRASEICALTCGDIDIHIGQCHVESGKGGKSRAVPFSRDVRRLLVRHLDERRCPTSAPLFVSNRGMSTGDKLTRSGLAQLLRRLGKAAGIEGVRCSPHTMRHSFSIGFLRAGGNVFTLQTMLGHSHMAMTSRYVALAQADIVNQHRQYSPVTRLKGGRGK